MGQIGYSQTTSRIPTSTRECLEKNIIKIISISSASHTMRLLAATGHEDKEY